MNIVFMSMDTLPSTLWARDLYDQMHIRSDFRKWFPRMCQYGFIEGRDYEYLMYQKMTHTLEDLKKLAAMELRDVNREELVDINDVEIKKDLSQRERMVDFVSQIKNPYCYLDRGMVVKISFAGENRLEDTLKKCARTHRK